MVRVQRCCVHVPITTVPADAAKSCCKSLHHPSSCRSAMASMHGDGEPDFMVQQVWGCRCHALSRSPRRSRPISCPPRSLLLHATWSWTAWPRPTLAAPPTCRSLAQRLSSAPPTAGLPRGPLASAPPARLTPADVAAHQNCQRHRYTGARSHAAESSRVAQAAVAMQLHCSITSLLVVVPNAMWEQPTCHLPQRQPCLRLC